MFRLRRPLFLSTLLLLAVCLPLSSAAQNPIQAAKDAWKRSMQQSKQQQQQKQQQGQQSQSNSQTNATQPAAASNNTSAPQDTAAPWTPPADNNGSAPPPAAVTLNPMKMPDIVGVHLGMTAAEAVAAVNKAYPGDMNQNIPVSSWPSAQKPNYGYNFLSRQPGNPKDMSISFTAPPGEQRVWRIIRRTDNVHTNRLTYINALREKYGKESIDFNQGQHPMTNPGPNDVIAGMLWLYDESGAHVPVPAAGNFQRMSNVTECSDIGTEEPVMPYNDDFTRGKADWCKQHYVALTVTLGFRNAGFDIVEYTRTYLEDVPLAVRTAQAANIYLHNLAEQRHKEDVERSKANKPVL